MKPPNSNKTSNKRQYILLKLADFSKRHVAVFAVVFGAIGGILLLSNSSAVRPAPTIYLTPETKTIAPNTEFSVQVRADSGAVSVNAVQANFSYPADLVDFVAIEGTGSDFTTEAPSTGANGAISIARGVIGGVSGDKLIATVKFKTKAANGTATFAFTADTALLDATTNADLLGALDKTTGAVYQIGTGGGTPNPNPPGPNPNPPTPNPNPTPGDKKLYLSPSTSSVAANGDFSVEVRSNSGAVSVNAVQANFSYPADLVDFVSIDAATSAFTTAAPSTGGSGAVSIARGVIGGISGDKLVAKVNFKAKVATGTANMVFTADTALLDGTTNVDILGSLAATAGGVYTIGGTNPNPPNPNPNPPNPNPPNPNPNPPNPPGPNPNPPNPNPTPLPGDIDLNGKVDLADLTAFLLRWNTTDIKADFDKDGRVTIFDLSILLSNYGK